VKLQQLLIMKRFSETDKWKDEWFSSLNPIEKLVFLFLIDSCDNAGFFELNQRLNSFLIGISEAEYLGAIKGLNRGLLGAKDGKVFWIKKFLFHQKNLPLNAENNAHKQIILILSQKKDLFSSDILQYLGADKGLFSPIGKGKGKGKVDNAGEIKKMKPPTLDEMRKYFIENDFSAGLAERAFSTGLTLSLSASASVSSIKNKPFKAYLRA